MAIDDLPLPVVNFLNVIGVPWPYIDEDVVLQFASLTREFGKAVRTTHEDATQAVYALAEAHRGMSTEAMRSGWGTMSDKHVSEIVTGCDDLAVALEAAAGYIVAQKAEAVAVLVGMAAAFVADQAAAVATAGIAEAAVPLIIEGAERLVKSLIMDLQQHVIGEVIEAAAKPLFAKVGDAVSGLDWSQSGGGGDLQPTQVQIDPVAVRTQLSVIRQHAAQMRQHGARFSMAVGGLGF
jgi:hypothetical protein